MLSGTGVVREGLPEEGEAAPRRRRSLDEIVANPGETFSERLLRLIRERGESPAQVYRRAGLDRRLFSKIRRDPQYRPAKKTVLALCAALHLNLDEAADLLLSAGYAFSPARRQDLIVGYCLENGIWDVMRIDEILYHYGEELIGV